MMRRWRSTLAGMLIAVLVLTSTVGAQPFNSQIQIAITQLTTGVIPFTALRNAASAYMNWGATGGVNGYGLRDNAGTMEWKNSAGAWTPIQAGSGAPTTGSYWTRVAEAGLSNETIMGALGTGLVINTTTTGVPTIYAGVTCTNQFLRVVSAIGAGTCAAVSLTADVTGTLPVANGGTGLTVGTSGGILGYTATGTIASSALLTANALILGGGAGVVPGPMASLGTTTTVLHGNAAGAPTFGAVVLTTDVSGILPGANGGTANGFFAVTGPTTSLKTFTFPNASSTVLTSNAAVTPAQGGTGLATYTIGDLLQASATTTLATLAATTTGNALISGGVGTVSAWGKIGLTTHISGTLGPTNGGTGFAAYTTGDLLYAVSGVALARLNDVAVGSVLVSGGVGVAPAWSATPRVTALHVGTALTFSATAPTVASGFGTSPVIAGTATAFRVDVGTGGTATDGVLTMPAATTAWNCHVENLTATTANRANQRTLQLGSTTTSVTIENQTISTGAALAWTASDVVALTCAAY